MTKNKPILVIDGNNLAHRAYHTHELSYKGKSVSIIFGVPQMLRTLINKFKPKKVIVVWDGKKHEHRLRLLPDYKAHRKLRAREDFDYGDFNRQKKSVMKLLLYLGVTQVRDPGMEADDMIYKLTQKYIAKRRVIICSNDKDFHQLICSDTQQWMDKETCRELLTPNNLKDIVGVEAERFVDYLCLVGDSTDDIPGYRGIGPKKAVKFLQDHETIEDFLESKIEQKGIDKKLLAEIYAKNRLLIDLEAFNTTILRGDLGITYLYDNDKPIGDITKFYEQCQRFNLRSFMKNSFFKSFNPNA